MTAAMPNGMTFIPKGRNVGIPNAPKGMKVLDAQRTAQLMGRRSPTFNYGVGYANGVGRIKLPAYSPESSAYAYRSSSTNTNNYSPSFTLNMSGTVDRTTERTIKKWVQEAFEEIFEYMSRTSPRVQEV